MILWSSGLVRSHDKLKSKYLHYHGAYGHQKLQAGDLPWEAFTHNVTPPFSHMVLWDHVAN